MKFILILALVILAGCARQETTGAGPKAAAPDPHASPAEELMEDKALEIRRDTVYLPDIGQTLDVYRVPSKEELEQEKENPVLAMEALYNDSNYDPGLETYDAEDMDKLRKEREDLINRPDPL